MSITRKKIHPFPSTPASRKSAFDTNLALVALFLFSEGKKVPLTQFMRLGITAANCNGSHLLLPRPQVGPQPIPGRDM